MARSIENIIADFDTLRLADFDLWNEHSRGVEVLDALTDEVLQTSHPQEAMDAMFRVVERLASADLGSPGPLVHTIEKLPNYKARLRESMQRIPTPYTVWMVNRILNTSLPQEQRQSWLDVLASVVTHPLATEKVKEDAQSFLVWQQSADRAAWEQPIPKAQRSTTDHAEQIIPADAGERGEN